MALEGMTKMENFLTELVEILVNVHEMDAKTIGETIQNLLSENNIKRIEAEPVDMDSLYFFDGNGDGDKVKVTIKAV